MRSKMILWKKMEAQGEYPAGQEVGCKYDGQLIMNYNSHLLKIL